MLATQAAYIDDSSSSTDNNVASACRSFVQFISGTIVLACSYKIRMHIFCTTVKSA